MYDTSVGTASIRTPDRRLRVFISSTMAELADERRAASEAVRSLHMSPVLFEMGARPHPPRELYTAYLQQSDVFIGIYGHQYGWIAPDMSISGIEDEYDQSSGKPRLIYVKKIPDRDERLAELLLRIEAEGMVSYKTFNTGDDLRDAIENDLALLLTERFQGSVASDASGRPGAYGALGWQLPPTPLTGLVGRRNVLSSVTRLLRRGPARLVVLTGPGGVGKTRLAIEIASRVRKYFADGVAWVDLASVGDEDLVLPSIAQAIRLPAAYENIGGAAAALNESMLESLAVRLASSHSLIILDNFEHVSEAAPLLPDLLHRCPKLTLLVTSRTSLNTIGEHEIRIDPLTLAETGAPATRDLVLESEAAQLLLERTRAVVPGFEVTDANAPALATLCSRVDGLPLGLELTASQLKYASPQDLARTEAPEAIQHGSHIDLPARQRSLQATLDWSYELLSESEKRLFASLSVFGDGFSLDAVTGVCGGDRPRSDLLADVYSLVDKSLVRTLSGADGQVRFGMFVTIRDYARQKLPAADSAPMKDRHARYYCDLVEAADALKNDRPAWLALLESETPNLRTVLAWALDDGDLNVGLRMAGALLWFWNIAGRLTEAATWLRDLLAKPWDDCGAEEQAQALYGAAWIAWRSEQYEDGRRYIDKSLALRRDLADQSRLALVLSCLGLIATSQHQYETAIEAHEEALSIFRGRDDQWGIAYALSNLGDVFLEMDRLQEASEYYRDGLALFTKAGDRWGQAIVLQTLGNLAWRRREVGEARDYYTRAVEHWRRMGTTGNAGAVTGLAAAMLAEGEVAEARRCLLHGIDVWRNLGSDTGVSICLDGLAAALALEGSYREAIVLASSARTYRADRPLPYALEPNLFDGFIACAAQHLDGNAAKEAEEEGKQVSIEGALERAISPGGEKE